MQKRIIFPTDAGGVSVIIPVPEARRQLLVSEAVYKTVPVPATDDQPEHEAQELVKPAVYRQQTDDEFLAWVAAKDVPAGKPFKIVSASDIPTDRKDRCAWTVDEQLLTDGVGADYGAGSDWAVVDWDGDGKPDALVNVITGETKKVGAA